MFKNDSRWSVLSIEEKNHRVYVKDNLLKKVRCYMVPNLTHASLNSDSLRVHTQSGKIMVINLPSGTRGFEVD